MVLFDKQIDQNLIERFIKEFFEGKRSWEGVHDTGERLEVVCQERVGAGVFIVLLYKMDMILLSTLLQFRCHSDVGVKRPKGCVTLGWRHWVGNYVFGWIGSRVFFFVCVFEIFVFIDWAQSLNEYKFNSEWINEITKNIQKSEPHFYYKIHVNKKSTKRASILTGHTHPFTFLIKVGQK